MRMRSLELLFILGILSFITSLAKIVFIVSFFRHVKLLSNLILFSLFHLPKYFLELLVKFKGAFQAISLVLCVPLFLQFYLL